MAATNQDILDHLNESIDKFIGKVPAVQKRVLRALQDEVQKLDVDNQGKLKVTVKNISALSKIKSKLSNIILDKSYKTMVKEFAGSFETLTQLQHSYWQNAESKFQVTSLMKEIKKQAILDTVKKLTESGIGANIEDKLIDILRTNITTGGSYSELTNQLKESLVDTPKGEGSLTKYASQIVTDSINQFSAQYTQLISDDLGFEWFAYSNSDIKTTRPFCDAMTDKRYYHISEVNDLIKGNVPLTYVNKKTGKREQVPINEKTQLPAGMIPDTNASNFQIRRGGFRCRHQARPIPERNVPEEIVTAMKNSVSYLKWKAGTGV